MKSFNKMYVVKYSKGSYDDYHELDIFVTADKQVVDKYIEKFNKRLDYWKEYMNSFKDEYGYRDDKKCTTAISYRYYDVVDIGYAFVEEVELR